MLIGDTVTVYAVGGDPDGDYAWDADARLELEEVNEDEHYATFRAQATGGIATITLTYTPPDADSCEVNKEVKVQVPTSAVIVAGLGANSVEIDPFADGPPVVMRVVIVFEVRDQDGEPVRGNGHILQERINSGAWDTLNPVNNDGRADDPKTGTLATQNDVDAWNVLSNGTVLVNFSQQTRMVLNAGGGTVTNTFTEYQLQKVKSTNTAFKVIEP
ncbi:MAG: hypothetical protein FJ395_07415 [Verrucomicrobia bacterium]|nr:hypothetical protein [Verrucomicrobiota bacterium]